VTPGLRDSYEPTTPDDPDEPLRIDAAAAQRLASWYALGDAALRRFADELDRPMDPVLWPEHFDLGISIDDVNYGVSPGDDHRPEPYLYVGPHTGPPSADEYWNAPFGAAVGEERIRTPQNAVAFFSEGRHRVLTDRSRT
jgi:hypothetical protein